MKRMLSILAFIFSIGIIFNGCDDVMFLWDSDETKEAKKAKWESKRKSRKIWKRAFAFL